LFVRERERDPRVRDQNTKLIGTGVAGALLSMLCCFTPVLVILLSALGLTAFVAKLDYVLVPLFVASVALVIFALVRRRRGCPVKMPQPN
jgi:mercuric ion transport protein